MRISLDALRRFARCRISSASRKRLSAHLVRLHEAIATLARVRRPLTADRCSKAILALQKLRCYTGFMNIELVPHADLSDDELLVEVVRLAASERAATVELTAALAEVDARRLYLGQGCSSLFVYCTSILHLSEHAAYGRIEAARAARRFPVLLELLARGELTLTSLYLVAPQLSQENHLEVLARVRHRSKREVQEVIASLRPRPDVPTTVRRVPEIGPVAKCPASSPGAASHPFAATPGSGPTVPSLTPAVGKVPQAAGASVRPLAPERYKLQVTISAATRAKLERAKDLLRHSLPSGDLAVVLDRALELLVADLERRKAAEVKRPRKGTSLHSDSRHIPAEVRRAVWKRDGGRCAFAGAQRRCNETAFLEFHHLTPFAAGGEATTGNIELRCRAHNQHEAELFFGEPFLLRERAPDQYSVQDRVEVSRHDMLPARPNAFPGATVPGLSRHRTLVYSEIRTMHHKALWPLTKRASKGFRGHPIATIAFYGPDDRRASKVAVGIIPTEGTSSNSTLHGRLRCRTGLSDARMKRASTTHSASARAVRSGATGIAGQESGCGDSFSAA